MSTETTEQPISVELVLTRSSQPIIGKGLSAEIVATLKPLVPVLAEVRARAAAIKVTSPESAAVADTFLDECRTNIKTVQAALKDGKTTAKQIHTLWTSLEGLFVDGFTEAGKLAKKKRDDWTAAEKAKADAETARLNALEAERFRKIREAEEQKAAAQRAIEAEKQRQADAARAAAAAAEGAERARLQREAEAAERAAAAARANAEVREEKAANVNPTIVYAQAPAARKGARTQVTCVSVDRVAFVKAAATNEMLAGLIDEERLMAALVKMKISNSMFDVKGVVVWGSRIV